MVSDLFASYTYSLQDSIEESRTVKIPPIGSIIGLVLFLVSVYIVLAIFIVPSDQPRHYNFAFEQGAIASLSAILLAMSFAFASLSFFLSLGAERAIRVFWFLLSCGTGFLALDELLMFHELGGGMIEKFSNSKSPIEGVFRSWNDVIVIMYGVIALPFALYFLPIILKYPQFLKLLCIAFAFYALHTVVDSISEPPTITSVIIEESAKLFCSSLIALSLFVGFLGHLERVRPQS